MFSVKKIYFIFIVMLTRRYLDHLDAAPDGEGEGDNDQQDRDHREKA